MFAAHTRRDSVVCDRRADSFDFIRGYAHANPGTANQNSEIILSLLHAPRNLDSEIGVINGLF
jgi:hypothetical protein